MLLPPLLIAVSVPWQSSSHAASTTADLQYQHWQATIVTAGRTKDMRCR
jgi:hypothetical protein